MRGAKCSHERRAALRGACGCGVDWWEMPGLSRQESGPEGHPGRLGLHGSPRGQEALQVRVRPAQQPQDLAEELLRDAHGRPREELQRRRLRCLAGLRPLGEKLARRSPRPELGSHAHPGVAMHDCTMGPLGSRCGRRPYTPSYEPATRQLAPAGPGRPAAPPMPLDGLRLIARVRGRPTVRQREQSL